MQRRTSPTVPQLPILIDLYVLWMTVKLRQLGLFFVCRDL